MSTEVIDTGSDSPKFTPEQLAAIEKRVKRAEAMAKIMDSKLVDPLMGLLDGAGDSAAAVAGAYNIYEARRAGVPPLELAKMLGRTGLDTFIGSIPLVGSFFDFAYKSNEANAKALREHFEKISEDADVVSTEEEALVTGDRAKERADLRDDIEHREAA